VSWACRSFGEEEKRWIDSDVGFYVAGGTWLEIGSRVEELKS
jgi:hypothetical protein